MIAGVDRAVGRVLDGLEELGLARNTVVLFSSDNGYFLGERGFAGKWLIYEHSIRVPLLVYDPRAPPGRRGTLREEMVLNIDLAPTILELAGLDVPASHQGRSLVPLLEGRDGGAAWREDFLYEHLFDHAQIPKSRGVRGRRWVYVSYFEQEPVHEELYDLLADPLQAHDRAADPRLADVLATMRRRCEELGARAGGR